jgi:hypothetical protein
MPAPVSRRECSQGAEKGWVVRDHGVDSGRVDPGELGRIVHRPDPDGRPRAVRALDRRRRDDRVVEHQRPGAGPFDHPRHAAADRASHRQSAGPDRRLEHAPLRHPVAVLRIGEPEPEVRRAGRERAQARQVGRADDRARREPVPGERVGDLVQPRRQLQIDVEADVALGQERETLVERRVLRHELGRRVRDHQRSAAGVDDVELDRVDAVHEGGFERAQCVGRREQGRPAVPDADQRPVAAQQPHGAVGRRSSSSSPPLAAYSTIIRSVTHSTGARSSVHGRFAFSVTGRTWRT